MGGATVDESRWPLVLVTFAGAIAEHEFDRYLDTMTRVLRRRTKYVVVFDARRATSTASQRSKQAAWLKSHRESIQQYSCGSVFVIASSLIRGALTAILWVSPIPGAYAVVDSLPEGERWAIDRLQAAGIAWPPLASKPAATA